MKIFLKWTLRAFLCLSAVVLVTVLADGIENIHIFDGIIAFIVGSFILGGLFYFLEVKWFPKRNTKLMKKISAIFGSNPVTNTITHFKLGIFDVYTELECNLVISQYQGNIELIKFHIPRNQIGYIVVKGKANFRESNCNGILTYAIYQTNSWGLKLAKKKIEKILSQSSLAIG